MKKLVIRKSTGEVFLPSYPTGYSEANAIVDCLSCERNKFYFRKLIWDPPGRHWWNRRGIWTETGEIWGDAESGEFDVVDESDPRLEKAKGNP